MEKVIKKFYFVSCFMGYIFLFYSLFFCSLFLYGQETDLSIQQSPLIPPRGRAGLLQSPEMGIKKSKLKEIGLHVSAVNRVKMPLAIYYLQEESAAIEPLISYIIKAFHFSGQFNVVIKKVTEKPSKKTIKEFFGSDSPLALFMIYNKKDNLKKNIDEKDTNRESIELYLFNTLEGKILFQKRCSKGNGNIRGWAYCIADTLWPVLTGQAPFFSSKIAYCKQVDLVNGKRTKHICMVDYDGTNEQTVVDLPTISVAPRWNNDLSNPLIFYSEYTNDNIRLMFVDMKKNRRVASNFDGINMLPAFSKDGKKVVYCASHGDGLCQLYYGVNGIFKKIGENKGNNISPSFIDDATIVFCSDFQTGTPHIYVYTIETGLLERITPSGYCTSPSYSVKRNSIAYSKMEKGETQIYMYDMKKKMHTRLTTGKGSKQEPSWSPCGNYLVFSIELGSQAGNQSKIGMLNMLTKETSTIALEGSSCSYPSWSPCFAFYPCL